MAHPPDREGHLTRLDAVWSHIARKISFEVTREATASGDELFTSVQIITLRMLRRRGPQTMSSLAEKLGISLSSANGLIEKLVESNLVVRVRDDEDRRVVRVELTTKGAERLSRGEARRARVLARYFSVLEPEELEGLVRLLEKVDHDLRVRSQ